jgi:hypothetical protein
LLDSVTINRNVLMGFCFCGIPTRLHFVRARFVKLGKKENLLIFHYCNNRAANNKDRVLANFANPCLWVDTGHEVSQNSNLKFTDLKFIYSIVSREITNDYMTCGMWTQNLQTHSSWNKR